ESGSRCENAVPMMGCVQITGVRKREKKKSGQKSIEFGHYLPRNNDAEPGNENTGQNQHDLGDPGLDSKQLEEHGVKDVGPRRGEKIVVPIEDLPLEHARSV